MLRWLSVLLILPTSAAPAQDAPRGIDQKAVDEAVDRGAEFLLEELRKGWNDGGESMRPVLLTGELILLTLAHAGVAPGDETFARLLKSLLDRDLSATYNVALLAMALEKIDRRLHQRRIADCGQFLVDSQSANGQRGYGESIGADRPRRETPTGGGGAKKSGSAESLPAIDIVRRGKGPRSGDNSNSQYAVLGLRACMEASVRIPATTFAEAEKWFERRQARDGGWSYDLEGMGGGGPEMPVYGSMTAGAVGTLVICKHYLKKGATKSPSVAAGFRWLDRQFSVTENPACPMGDAWHYYYLYALDRAAMLHGAARIGRHDWYVEGTAYLLKRQGKDGSWIGGTSGTGDPAPAMDSRITDSCFAILFLRRTTKPVRPDVATGDSRKPKEGFR